MHEALISSSPVMRPGSRNCLDHVFQKQFPLSIRPLAKCIRISARLILLFRRQAK